MSRLIELHNGQIIECASLEQARKLVQAGSGRILPKVKEVVSRTISSTKRETLIKMQNNQCALCKEYLDDSCEIDHIHPWSLRHCYRNGIEKINELGNLQALCKKCNRKKRNYIDWNRVPNYRYHEN